jgi:AmmeMemoRadiSam system protein B
MDADRIRPPAVAGRFYPGDPAELDASVRSHLALARSAAEDEPPDTHLKAVIVPHAGFVYSGSVAASAYLQVAAVASRVRRVVLLGPSHRVFVQGLASSSADAFATPLGRVPLDRDAIARAEALPAVVADDTAHADEHSLEVQLPFLQSVLGDFLLVPFAVGEASTEEVDELLGLLWGGDETLIVISSDLSHYYEYDTARRLDRATMRAIEALDPEDLDAESACGRIPVCGLLAAARRYGLTARTLDLRNSGDTAGSHDQVVGYGAWAFA